VRPRLAYGKPGYDASVMNETLQDWPRPHYARSFGPAFHFYAVLGPVAEPLSVSSSRHRCDGIPEGIDIMRYESDKHPGLMASFREGYLWEALRSSDPGLAELIAVQDQCMVLRGEIQDGPSLNDFRNIIGLVTSLLESGGIAVYDPQRFKWWGATEWREQVFEPGEAQPRSHVTILFSDDEAGTEWFHTRGMRKFGRPDLSLHGVTTEHRAAVIELFERFIEYQASGGVIEDGEEISMRALPGGMRCHNAGSYDNEDFNNVHVEISWPED